MPSVLGISRMFKRGREIMQTQAPVFCADVPLLALMPLVAFAGLQVTFPWHREVKASTRSLLSHAQQLELLCSQTIRQPLISACCCCLPCLQFVVCLSCTAVGEQLYRNDIQSQHCSEQGAGVNTSVFCQKQLLKPPDVTHSSTPLL